jgi:2-hydroxy-3-keto-5-methylthiopentenyl-1-phosphate phosphatase
MTYSREQFREILREAQDSLGIMFEYTGIHTPCNKILLKIMDITNAFFDEKWDLVKEDAVKLVVLPVQLVAESQAALVAMVRPEISEKWTTEIKNIINNIDDPIIAKKKICKLLKDQNALISTIDEFKDVRRKND